MKDNIFEIGMKELFYYKLHWSHRSVPSIFMF